MPKKKRNAKPVTSEEVESLKKIEQLHSEAEECSVRIIGSGLKRCPRESSRNHKKDEGVSPEKLPNREKAIMTGALRNKYKLHELLDIFHMAKSSYCYRQAALATPDKYNEVCKKIRSVFDDSFSRYGYRRIHSSLKTEDIAISEK